MAELVLTSHRHLKSSTAALLGSLPLLFLPINKSVRLLACYLKPKNLPLAQLTVLHLSATTSKGERKRERERERARVCVCARVSSGACVCASERATEQARERASEPTARERKSVQSRGLRERERDAASTRARQSYEIHPSCLPAASLSCF